MDKEKLFKDYFEVYFEFSIDLKLNESADYLINQYYDNIVEDFLINQNIDITNLLNINILDYRQNKNYSYYKVKKY